MDPIQLPDCCAPVTLTAEAARSAVATVTLAVHGEIDTDNVDHLTHLLSAALRAARPLDVLDLGGVTFLGSSGIRALVSAHAEAEATGRRLVLREPRPTVYRVLELTGLLDVFGLPARAVPRSHTRMVDALFEPSA